MDLNIPAISIFIDFFSFFFNIHWFGLFELVFNTAHATKPLFTSKIYFAVMWSSFNYAFFDLAIFFKKILHLPIIIFINMQTGCRPAKIVLLKNVDPFSKLLLLLYCTYIFHYSFFNRKMTKSVFRNAACFRRKYLKRYTGITFNDEDGEIRQGCR